MNKLKVLLLLAALALGLTAGALAQLISGPLSGTLGPGTYTVVGNCQVNAGQTLTIRPGTVFEHIGFYTWTINGQFQALGTSNSLIRFTRQQPIAAHKWGGLRFMSSGASGSLLEYCVIEECDSTARPGGGIYASYADITLRHCTITNCMSGDGGGIYATYSNIVLEYCEISYNTAYYFSGSTVPGYIGNGGGIYLVSCANPRISRCSIHHNNARGA